MSDSTGTSKSMLETDYDHNLVLFQVKGFNSEETVHIDHQAKSGQFVVRTSNNREFTISDTINLADPVQYLTINGQKHTLQLVSRSSVGKIALQFLGSVFPFHVYQENVSKYLPFMHEKRVADTSRQV